MNCDNYIPVSAESSGHPTLICPICGHDYVHPVGIACLSPGSEHGCVEIDADGISLDANRSPHGRGTKITLAFVGECGHAFNYVMHFEKGQTLVTRQMTDAPEPCPETIWRS